jgi:hypothetical protein
MSQKIIDTAPASSATKFSSKDSFTRYFKVVDSVEDELGHEQCKLLVADVDLCLQTLLRNEVELDQAVIAVLQNDLQQQVGHIPDEGSVHKQRGIPEVEDPLARKDSSATNNKALTEGW